MESTFATWAYAGEEIRVDALAERIDTTERDIDDETYHI